MITALLIAVGCLAIIVALALLLPCEACRLRRERMKRAYTEWQSTKSKTRPN
jgi:hypothetical protein